MQRIADLYERNREINVDINLDKINNKVATLLFKIFSINKYIQVND